MSERQLTDDELLNVREVALRLCQGVRIDMKVDPLNSAMVAAAGAALAEIFKAAYLECMRMARNPPTR